MALGQAPPLLQVDLSDLALRLHPVVPVENAPMPINHPGAAIRIADLGHGSVWVQYRRHTSGRPASSLTEAARLADYYGLGHEKLGWDFAKLLEEEIYRSDMTVRIAQANAVAMKMFETCVDDYHFRQQAGRAMYP